jgi:hypothetical protein
VTGEYHSLKTAYRSKVPFWTPMQRDCFDTSYDMENFAIYHEPRCGKSKIVVDTCCYHHWAPNDPRHIRGAFVSAWPNAAHDGWILDAFPESFVGPWKGFRWNTDDAMTKTNRKAFDELLKYEGFAVLTVGADTLISENFRADLGRFLVARGAILLGGDESSFMIEPGARRSQIMHKVSHDPKCRPFIKMRRILDGTPCDAAGPLDFYNQMGFLDWNILGYKNEVEFRNHYAEIETRGRNTFWGKVRELIEGEVRAAGIKDVATEVNRRMRDPVIKENYLARAKRSRVKEIITVGGTPKEINRPMIRGRDWWTVIAEDKAGMPKFKNMDEFWERMTPYSDRRTFAECFPNAPRPIFGRAEFDLTTEQRRVYNELEKEHTTILDDGYEIDVAHHLARTLRLQQIASNYYPEQDIVSLHKVCLGLGCEACDGTGIVEGKKPLKLIDKTNPRMDRLKGLLDERPTIIWCRFKQDIDTAVKVAEGMGFKVCQYDGRISRKSKLDARLGFQAGTYDKFVANQSAASRGLPLHRGLRQIVVSNIFSRTRRQMEERTEHGRKTDRTEIIDLVARKTVDDEVIIPSLRTGMDVSNYVNRDLKREWL